MSIRCLSALLTVTVILPGCSGGGMGATEQKPTYEVTGTIKMAGGPVANAAVTFSPKQGQPVATGRTDTQGKYTLTTYDAGDGAAEGEYVVLVSKSGGKAQTNEQASHEAYTSGAANPGSHDAKGGSGGADAGLPAQYSAATTSDLKATVTTDASKNVFDFDLKP